MRWAVRRAVVALGALLVGCTPEAPSEQANLVLIVLDTVRADHLSVSGYERATSPFLERFAQEGTRFGRAWSSSSWTLPAHASMFTGLPVRLHGADQDRLRLEGDPELLAELLVEAGYQTAAFSNNPWVSRRTSLARGFESFHELWRRRQRPAAPLSDPSSAAVRAWLDEERDPARPFFLFVNLMEAHGPYEPSWRAAWPLLGPLDAWNAAARYGAVEEEGFVRTWYAGEEPVDPQALAAAVDLYDAELRQADAVAERIVRAVDERADPAATTVLVLSDHGEAFGEHGHVGHAFSVYDTLLRVALLARGPGFAAGAVEQGVAQVDDVFPTLLDAAGIDPRLREGGARDLEELPAGTRGIEAAYGYPRQVLQTFPAALRRSPRLDPQRRALRAGLDGRYKLIRDSRGREELYDLQADPGELTPLSAPDPALLERLRSLAGEPGAVEDDGDLPGIDPESAEALEELGYLDPG